MSATSTEGRMVYIPRMSDHACVMAAALRAHGIEAEPLPAPDAESLAIGLDLCHGRECLPCFLCIGDIVRRARAPGFEPGRALFFLPTGPGPCRFGQYRYLARDVLEDLGLGAIDLVSPTSADAYALFGSSPVALRALAFQGLAAIDLLQKLLHEHRPYETRPGAADQAYATSLERVCEAVQQGGGRRLLGAMRDVARLFEGLGTNRREARPVVGIVGELYVMLNPFSNRGLVREIEAVGGEALQSTFVDWLVLTDWSRAFVAWRRGDYREWAKARLVHAYQVWTEHRLQRPVRHLLRQPPESGIPATMKALTPYYEPRLGTEGVLTMGRAIDYARHGVSGILNVLPFSCMPGIVAAGMAPRLRRDLEGIPWLDLSYDCQQETNIRTRLEAFMHQVAGFAGRRHRAAAC